MKIDVHAPKNTKKYDKFYAILSQDDDGKEGLVAGSVGDSPMPVPLVCADPSTLPIIETIALEYTEQIRQQNPEIKIPKLIVAEFARIPGGRELK